MNDQELIKGIARHYEQTFAVHGATSRGVDWGSEEEVRMRYEKMLDVMRIDYERPPEPPSILDVGCGWGGLFAYIRERGIQVRYTGIDLVGPMIEHARRVYHGAEFLVGNVLQMEGENRFDYVVGSGIMALKLENNIPKTEAFVREATRAMYRLCSYGAAFNLMSNRVNFMADKLYYTSPSEFLSFCLSDITPRVRLDHGYSNLGRGQGRLYEYTVYLYKDHLHLPDV